MRVKTQYVCQSCGYQAAKWHGRCPGCGSWNSMVEEIIPPTHEVGRRLEKDASDAPRPLDLSTLTERPEAFRRIPSGISEWDRVLGGGLVPGSLILIGGEPGVGKSTLIMQVALRYAGQGETVLYVSGEESVEQVGLRARRLGGDEKSFYLLSESRLEHIADVARKLHVRVLIIDSIQTMRHPDITSAPGSVAQVREGTTFLLDFAKTSGVATLIVGHVTKSGDIAGPRMLEHMVDTVLYFEGDRDHFYRLLRAMKNRFGSTYELGVFEMQDRGLIPHETPGELFLRERQEESIGSAVLVTIEGTRPFLLEIQALLVPSLYPAPRRTASGYDLNRLHMLLAVLEKKAGLHLMGQDAYVNVVGGMRIGEPAGDLATALAIASSFRERPLSARDVYLGEIGLTGEVRQIPRLLERLKEAQSRGFRRALVPPKGDRVLEQGGEKHISLEVVPVQTIQEALMVAFAY